jgi:hypothetical protein
VSGGVRRCPEVSDLFFGDRRCQERYSDGAVSQFLLQFLEEVDKDLSANVTSILGQHAPYQVNLSCWNGALGRWI